MGDSSATDAIPQVDANITQLIEYYKALSSLPRADEQLFVLCHAPIPYRNAPSYLQLKDYDPSDQRPPLWQIIEKPITAFDGKHPPIKTLGLEAKEEFIAFRAKMRPCIPIAFTERNAFSAEDVRSKSFCQPMAMVVPLTTFYDSGGRLKPYFTDRFYQKAASFGYSQFMYFPHGGCLPFDGFAQLDRLCPVPVSDIEPIRTRLTEECQELLMACLRAFLNKGIFTSDADQYWGKRITEDLQPQYMKKTPPLKTG